MTVKAFVERLIATRGQPTLVLTHVELLGLFNDAAIDAKYWFGRREALRLTDAIYCALTGRPAVWDGAFIVKGWA